MAAKNIANEKPDESIARVHGNEKTQEHASAGGSIAAVVVVIVVVLIVIGAVFYIIPKHTAYKPTVNSTTTISSITKMQNPSLTTPNYSSCSGFVLSEATFNSTDAGICKWAGGVLGVAYGSGNSNYISFSITNIQSNNTYVSINSASTCNTSAGGYNLPAGEYSIEIRDGPGGGNCGNAFVELT